MRRSKPLAVLAGAALLALAACGGSGGDSNTPGSGSSKTFTGAATDIAKNPDMQGPAPDIEGATTGGTITVQLPGDPGPDSLDPTDGWSVTGNSIQQALTTRSLTQYYRDPDSGNMILVPDLATDLGTPNTDFTSWTFTLKDGIKWEDGSDITAEQVAFGIKRSLDSDTFPGGPGTEYSKTYFKDADTYKGPYTDPKADYQGVQFDNDAKTVTIEMSKPFPDMDYWGAFMAIGPVPLGKVSNPPDYGKKPLSSGPYKVESFRPNEELTLVKNDQWDPATDPARHQYADKWVFKFNADQNQVDQVVLSGNTEAETTVSTSIGSENYSKASSELGDRLVQQSSQCVSTTTPDYTKIKDIRIRKAIAYAIPYEDVWLASGEVPGVTRVPASTVMPPGMAGRKEYQPDGEQISFQPDKAKELLKEAGYAPGEFKLTYVYYELDPLGVAANKQLMKGYEAAGFSVKAIPVQESPYNIWLDPSNKINKTLNVRGVNWCSDWPSALTFIPPLLRGGATYNTAQFDEPAINDKMDAIPTMPADQQAAAWGDLDEEIGTKYFPIIPTAYRNDLFTFGSKIGYPSGDGSIGAPYYKGLYVMQ